MLNNFPFRKSCSLWENVEKYGRARQAKDDNKISRKRFAHRIIKVTNTLKILNIFAFPTEAQVTRTRLSIILNLHCLFYYYCVSINALNAQNMQAQAETCLYRI